MRNDIFDITEILYKQINIDSVLNQISGTVYRESNAIDDGKENIIIITNSIGGKSSRGVNSGIVNINIEVPEIDNSPDISRFETIIPLVKNALSDDDSRGFYATEIDNQIFKLKNSYYYNIKLEIHRI